MTAHDDTYKLYHNVWLVPLWLVLCRPVWVARQGVRHISRASMLRLGRHHSDALYALLDQALPADKLKTDLTVNVQLAQLPVGNAKQFHSNLKVLSPLPTHVQQTSSCMAYPPTPALPDTHSTKQQPAPLESIGLCPPAAPAAQSPAAQPACHGLHCPDAAAEPM